LNNDKCTRDKRHLVHGLGKDRHDGLMGEDGRERGSRRAHKRMSS
jgi:hypothetical protein